MQPLDEIKIYDEANPYPILKRRMKGDSIIASDMVSIYYNTNEVPKVNESYQQQKIRCSTQKIFDRDSYLTYDLVVPSTTKKSTHTMDKEYQSHSNRKMTRTATVDKSINSRR